MLRNSLFGVGAVTILCCSLSACVATDDSNQPLANAPTAAIGAAHSYAAAKPKTGGPAWSGTSGASGHPAMHAQAIRAAAADFQRCINDLQAPASRRGISRASFIRHTAGLTPDLRLMDLMDSQPEFTKAVWDYLEALVNEERIASRQPRTEGESRGTCGGSHGSRHHVARFGHRASCVR